jgi:hypothetical protein
MHVFPGLDKAARYGCWACEVVAASSNDDKDKIICRLVFIGVYL